jgi:hypothetical protein
MGDTKVFSVEADARRRQIEKITQSPIFHGSESLCHLLKYLSEQSAANPGMPVKEHQIATDVFRRPADFDPRLDSSVRVQTGRLRAKLHDYYATLGAQDQLVVELPRGSYALLFEPKAPATDIQRVEAPPVPMAPLAAKPNPRRWMWLAAGLFLGLAVFTVMVLWTQRQLGAPAELKQLWAGFLDTPDPPLVVYSNAEFVGRPETGMRYFDPARDEKQTLLDHYTGVGEVQAVYELGHMFQRFNRALRVKRGRLLSWDDAKANDVVFIGSPSENLSLRDLPTTRRFSFERESDGIARAIWFWWTGHLSPGRPPAIMPVRACRLPRITPLWN